MPYADRHGRTCGFMDLEDQDQNGRFFRRYFIIDQERGLFVWYMDNPLNLPDGAVPVGEVQLSSIANARDATKQRPKVEFCFEVTIPSQTNHMYFKADNQQDLEEWVSSLNKACRVTVPTTEPSKAAAPLKVDIAKAKGQGSSSPKSPIRGTSYTTEIVGGVVHRKAVESSDKRTSQQTLPGSMYLEQFSSSQNEHSETDSEDENASLRTQARPRSVSPTSGNDRSLTRVHANKNVIKSGWCVKQGGVRKNWKRRFFILDDHGLAYYKSSTDKLPLKMILKKDIDLCKPSDIGFTLQRDNLFEIVSPSRTFYIQAYSPDDMAEWINLINQVRSPKRVSAPQATIKQTICSKIVEGTRDLLCEGRSRSLTPHETENTVTYVRSHSIEIRIDKAPDVDCGSLDNTSVNDPVQTS